MVDFSFAEEQELIREGLNEWCEKKISLEKIGEIDEKQSLFQGFYQGWSYWVQILTSSSRTLEAWYFGVLVLLLEQLSIRLLQL